MGNKEENKELIMKEKLDAAMKQLKNCEGRRGYIWDGNEYTKNFEWDMNRGKYTWRLENGFDTTITQQNKEFKKAAITENSIIIYTNETILTNNSCRSTKDHVIKLKEVICRNLARSKPVYREFFLLSREADKKQHISTKIIRVYGRTKPLYIRYQKLRRWYNAHTRKSETPGRKRK